MLELKDVRTKLPFNITYKTCLFAIRDLFDYPLEYIVDFDVYLPTKGKNLQRPFVWNLLQKQELVMSKLKGIEIPPLTVIQYKDYAQPEVRVYKIIDGKQRLSSLISFAKGEFPIVVNGQEYFIKDLSQECQNIIVNEWFECNVGYEYVDKPISDDNKIKWFELINFAGTPQDIEHMNSLKI